MSRITLPATNIILADDEIYAGLILKDDGTPSHHLVLLPSDHENAKWQIAIEWAKSLNGELPTRREQSLLFANCKQHFENDWYWSSELYASDASSAWYQFFGYGDQYYSRTFNQCRARAVRRLIIE